MRTYRQVFAVAEFRALFGGQLAIGASMTIQALAVSVLVYDRTASPLLAAAGFLAGSLPQAVGAVLLSGLSDRLAPRVALVTTDLVRGTAALAIAAGVLPIAGILAVSMAGGVLLGALAGIRLALVTRVLPREAYVLGRSTLDIAGSAMQITGYAAGGVLITVLGAPGAMWCAVGLAATAGLADWRGVHRHDRARQSGDRARRSWRGSWRLMRDPVIGRLLLAQWIPNGLIVGAEALFVPYAGDRSAVLLTATAVGLLAGTAAIARLLPAGRRTQAAAPLYLLLALPYLAFASGPPWWLAVALVGVASCGYAGTLCIQQRLVSVVGQESIGQALALASAGMLTAQGLAAYLAGAIAQLASPGVSIAAMGGLSVLATIMLLTRRRAGWGGVPDAPAPRVSPESSAN